MYPLPDPAPQFEKQEPLTKPWSIVDLGLFIGFSVLVAFVALAVSQMLNLGPVQQVVLQGVMNAVLIGFIAVQARVVHRQSFVSTIHWFRNYDFNTTFLIATGTTLALISLGVIAFFPPREPPPLEKFLSTPGAMYAFAIFGTLVAPLFEEILFRGFLFKVLHDISGPSTAVVVTALVFALLHIVQLWGSWAGIVFIFGVGYILSWVRRRSDSLIPSFIIHTSYNATLFGLAALGTLQKP
jgi:membrane protease YdiL (CAAX protease family)